MANHRNFRTYFEVSGKTCCLLTHLSDASGNMGQSRIRRSILTNIGYTPIKSRRWKYTSAAASLKQHSPALLVHIMLTIPPILSTKQRRRQIWHARQHNTSGGTGLLVAETFDQEQIEWCCETTKQTWCSFDLICFDLLCCVVLCCVFGFWFLVFYVLLACT